MLSFNGNATSATKAKRSSFSIPGNGDDLG